MAGEKAHDSIDNLLVANTLQEILRNPRGEYTDLLYKVQAKSGKDRYIHQGLPGVDTDERRAFAFNMLRTMLEQNPEFADTLSLEEGKKKLQSYPSLGSKIKGFFGF